MHGVDQKPFRMLMQTTGTSKVMAPGNTGVRYYKLKFLTLTSVYLFVFKCSYC